MRDKILMWIAWRLPRRLAMWVFIRVAAYATTGEYASTIVPSLTALEALKRWDPDAKKEI